MRCAAGKDTPLGRCAACGHTPEGQDRALALLCSAQFLDPAQRQALQERIRRGEALKPSAVALAQAQNLLEPPPKTLRLSNTQLGLLLAGNLLLTPMLGYALWFRARGDPAGRQALLVTLPCTLLLAIALIAWRYWLVRQAQV